MVSKGDTTRKAGLEAEKMLPSIRDMFLLFRPWNTSLNIVLYGLAYVAALHLLQHQHKAVLWPVAFLIYCGFLFISDVAYYVLQIPVVCPNDTLKHGYNLAAMIDDSGSATGDGLDYDFNFYNGDYTKTRRQAQTDKYEHAYAVLGLKPDMTVIDCGCGCGDWLSWLQSRGIHAIGINITPLQAKLCKDRGLEVYLTDWKKIADDKFLSQKLFNQADAVTFWDTIEHYVPAQHRKDVDAQDAIYSDMFSLAKSMLKPTTECGRVWTSCLHHRDYHHLSGAGFLTTLCTQFNNYILDKFHSCYYPSYEARQLSRVAKECGLKTMSEENLTVDYYMTSKLSPEHFGRLKFVLSARRVICLLLNVIVDPNWIPRLFWLTNESWMNQFEEGSLDESPMQLLWICLSTNPRDTKTVDSPKNLAANGVKLGKPKHV